MLKFQCRLWGSCPCSSARPVGCRDGTTGSDARGGAGPAPCGFNEEKWGIIVLAAKCGILKID